MRLISDGFRRYGADTFAVLFILICCTFLIGPVVHAALDRNQKCVFNAYTVTEALLLYAQDYDEVLPVFGNASTFRPLILPYTKDNSLFLCPATGNIPFTPNTAMSGKNLASFPNPETVEALRDTKAHPDGKLTISFLDGHVERGGVDQPYADGTTPATQCIKRQRLFYLGLAMYLQDYDEVFPPYQNDTAFKQALDPYIKNKRAYTCPDSGQPFILGKQYRGQALSGIADLSPIEVVRDPVKHKSGVTTVTYLDGYTEQRGPQGIVYPSPIAESQVRIQRITQALLAYAQDHAGQLPTYTDYTQFAAQVGPYTQASRSLVSPGAQSFQVNLNLSGTNLVSYPNPSAIIVLKDINNYGDGLITVGYLDGSVQRVGP